MEQFLATTSRAQKVVMLSILMAELSQCLAEQFLEMVVQLDKEVVVFILVEMRFSQCLAEQSLKTKI